MGGLSVRLWQIVIRRGREAPTHLKEAEPPAATLARRLGSVGPFYAGDVKGSVRINTVGICSTYTKITKLNTSCSNVTSFKTEITHDPGVAQIKTTSPRMLD